jgi:hypothetical protein
VVPDEDVKLPTTTRTSSSTATRMSASPAEGSAILVGRKHGAILKNQGCSCRRSKCVKLYCVCWSNKIMCSSRCTCTECTNVPRSEGGNTGSTEKEVVESPLKPSSSPTLRSLPPGVITDTCSCRRSKCLARYCQCYASAFRCTESCTCVGCLNKGSRTADNDGVTNSDGDYSRSSPNHLNIEAKG